MAIGGARRSSPLVTARHRSTPLDTAQRRDRIAPHDERRGDSPCVID
jgi:hypothetical protein